MQDKTTDKQLDLFGEEVKLEAKKVAGGGSSNPIVFRDYESFISKFTENPKTTDECWTPQDVYEAVVKYVGEITDLTDKVILRPFYPGGDYINAEYPENGVVIDNPPFSMFTSICAFYAQSGIPFFLFGPGLTIASCCRYCTAVIVSSQIKFTNGAIIKCNFATNLMGDVIMTTSIRLDELIRHCPSQTAKAKLPKYCYPDEVLSVSDFQTMAKGFEDFSVLRNEVHIIKDLDRFPKKGGLFGDHLLVTKAAAVKAAAVKVQHIGLSEREQKTIERMEQRKKSGGNKQDTTI